MNAPAPVSRVQDIDILFAGIGASGLDGQRLRPRPGLAETGRLPGAGQKCSQRPDLVRMQKNLCAVRADAPDTAAVSG